MAVDRAAGRLIGAVAVVVWMWLLLTSPACADTYEIASTDSIWTTMIKNGNVDQEDSTSYCGHTTLYFGKLSGINSDIERVLWMADFSGTPCTGDEVDSVTLQFPMNLDGGRSVSRCSSEVFMLLTACPLTTCESDTTGGCGNINMQDANICTTAWNTDMCDGEGTDREASPRAYIAEEEDAGLNTSFTFLITDLAKTWIDYPDSNLGAIVICTEEGGNISTFQHFVWYDDDPTEEVNLVFVTVYYTVDSGGGQIIIIGGIENAKSVNYPDRAMCERDNRYR